MSLSAAKRFAYDDRRRCRRRRRRQRRLRRRRRLQKISDRRSTAFQGKLHGVFRIY